MLDTKYISSVLNKQAAGKQLTAPTKNCLYSGQMKLFATYQVLWWQTFCTSQSPTSCRCKPLCVIKIKMKTPEKIDVVNLMPELDKGLSELDETTKMEDYQFKGVPTFRITNYKKAIDFYINFLGFSIDWEHRFGDAEPIYMQISKNGLVLHLSENKRFNKGVIIFVETKGIDLFRNSLLKIKKGKLIPDIVITNWNTKQLEIEDPFGNLLRFNEQPK